MSRVADIHHATLRPGKVELVQRWIGAQRWYAAKGTTPALTTVGSYRFVDPDGQVGIETLLVRDGDAASSDSVIYQVPLTYRGAPLAGADRALVGTMDHSVLGPRWVYDATHDPAYASELLRTIVAGDTEAARSDGVVSVTVRGDGTHPDAAPVLRSAHVLTGEQSNTSIILSVDDPTGLVPRDVIVKVFRVVAPGDNPDVTVQAALAEADPGLVPDPVGSLRGSWPSGTGDRVEGHLAAAQVFVPGVRDAWRVAIEVCRADRDFSVTARVLGETTARIHRSLAARFGTTPATGDAKRVVMRSVRSRFVAAVAEVPALAVHAAAVEAAMSRLSALDWPDLQRVHGDFHLGQVLYVDPSHVLVIDFEGEPLRPLTERTAPDLALRDVAGMLRSFDYVAGTVTAELPGARRDEWARACQRAFLEGYHAIAGTGATDIPVTQALELDKALYEVVYEARNRPAWLPIPHAAVERLVATVSSPEPATVFSATLATPAAPEVPEVPNPRSVMEPVQTQAMVADESAISAFLEARHSQPHDLLGHHLGPVGLTVTAYRPLARSVRARLQDGTILDLPHVRGGIWSGTTDVVNESQDYRLLVDYGDGVEHEQDDPYRFAPTLGEMDRFLINEGRHEQLWEVLGSHVRQYGGPLGDVWGVSFAVWAPNATAVHVVGDFNGWDRISHPMRLLGESGVWELFIPGASEGMNYQFAIRGQDTVVRLKADPMARFSEVAPKQASIVHRSHYEWGDHEWLAERAKRNAHHGPMSIYEVHVGSWRQGQNYRDLAEHLVHYVRDLGFTHVEFLPVMEHPYVPSWGYHVTGYYSVSSRWGTPDDFKYLVDILHRNGIGVILDWVPGHFATDEWALARFDGQALYEHPDPRKGWHNEWGSYVFDFGRNEVRNFLVANATYWLEEFHVDGLRVDGVASMLYLDYSRQPGQWIPNIHGGRENLDAVQLLQEANATAYKRTPGVVMIAEESTSWAGVSKPTTDGGLGFGFKWNMGWMNDALRYLNTDPMYRQYEHNKITFALMYAYSENFILPISHDEVVHGKGSLMRKSRGSREDRIATLRAFISYMWSHPGKQLLFMGCEFGQESEWSDGRSLDWWLLEQPIHYRIHAQVKEMNAIYRANPAMWELDHEPAGFRWLNADDAGRNTFSYVRIGQGDPAVDAPLLVAAVNFSGQTHEHYRIGLPRGGRWRVVLDTAGFHPDAPSSGGLVLDADPHGWDGQPYAVNVTIARLSAIWLIPED